MPRNLWGEFKAPEESTSIPKKEEPRMVPLPAKRRKLAEIDEKISITLDKSSEQR